MRPPRPARLRCALALIAGFLLATVTAAWAAQPLDELRHVTDQVLRILNDRELGGPKKTRERREALRRAIDPLFDFDETARRALGLHWRERTAEERRQFVGLFKALLERTYISKIEAYAGERIVYLRESVDGDYATVETKIVTKHGTEVPVDYEMLRRDGRWLVYDVRIEGVSLVENYRAQFNAILDTSSYETLVQRIEARVRAPEDGQ